MKKYLPFFLLLWSVTVHAQTDSASSYSYYATPKDPSEIKRNIMKFAPFKLAASTMSLSYERAISPRSSLMITGLLVSATNRDYDYTGYNVIASGAGGDLEIRNYPLSDYVPLKGYFVGFYGSYNYTEFDYKATSSGNNNGYYYPTPTDEYITRYGGGILMGYQFIVKETLAFDIYAGGGVRKVDTNIGVNNSYYYNPFNLLSSGTSSGIYPRAGFNFGICF